MGHVFRNVAFAVALLVILQASSEALGRPSQKDGGDAKGRGKGRRSLADAEEESISALEGAVYDALAEDALVDGQERKRRAADDASPLAEDSDDVVALDETGGDARGQLKGKKPCRGGRGGGRGGGGNGGGDTNDTGTDSGTDTEGTGASEAENMRQRQGRRSRNRGSATSTPEPSKLVSWLLSDGPEESW